MLNKVTSADLVKRIVSHFAQERDERPRVMYTILVGAGASLGAGMPSTSMLVHAMKKRQQAIVNNEAPSWQALLDDAWECERKNEPPAPGIADEYQMLFSDTTLFPGQPHQQRFVSDAILWAAARQPPMSPVSLRLASLLLAGAGRSPSRKRAEDPTKPHYAAWFANTVYTTNFDEVLPQTFHYCGEPAIVVDHRGAHGRLQGDARYPRVAYLHGSHLYYGLRNTPAELLQADVDRSDGVDLRGIFDRFRDVLRSTGLIVLGYSGWNDRAMKAIGDALADPESLPYGVYWGARFGDLSLSEAARGLLGLHSHRAFMLDEGKELSDTLDTLCDGLNVGHNDNVYRWVRHFGQVMTHLRTVAPAVVESAGAADSGGDSVLVSPDTAGVSKLQFDVEKSLLVKKLWDIADNFDRVRALDGIARARQLMGRIAEAGSEPIADLTHTVGFLEYMTGQFSNALSTLEEAVRAHKRDGRSRAAAAALATKARAFLNLFRLEEAQAAADDARRSLEDEPESTNWDVLATEVEVANVRCELKKGRELWRRVQPRLEDGSIAPQYSVFLRREVSRWYRLSGQANEAKRFARQALEAATSKVERSRTLVLLGLLELDEARLAEGHGIDRALEHFRLALELSHDIGDQFGEMEAQLGLGNCELLRKEPQASVEHFGAVADLVNRGTAEQGASPGGTIADSAAARASVGKSEAAQMQGIGGNHTEAAELASDKLENLPQVFEALEARLAVARIDALAERTSDAKQVATRVKDRARELHLTLAERLAQKELEALLQVPAALGSNPYPSVMPEAYNSPMR